MVRAWVIATYGKWLGWEVKNAEQKAENQNNGA